MSWKSGGENIIYVSRQDKNGRSKPECPVILPKFISQSINQSSTLSGEEIKEQRVVVGVTLSSLHWRKRGERGRKGPN